MVKIVQIIDDRIEVKAAHKVPKVQIAKVIIDGRHGPVEVDHDQKVVIENTSVMAVIINKTC